MQPPPKPSNEAERLAALHAQCILDTPPEERFDRITRLAIRLFRVPIALVSLVDAERQWFKSCVGLGVRETPRELSFCGHAILQADLMVVEDALRDERFQDNPLVVGAPAIRFYAGHPISMGDGLRVGTLCIIDREPRVVSSEDRELLRDLGRMIEEQLTAMRLATVDELTGLSNRRGFLTIANHALAMCQRSAQPATLAYLDLDRFKEINDSLGHATGDEALREFADILLDTYRGSDILGRLGGDEFCVCFLGTSLAETERPIQRLQEALHRRNESGASPYRLNCSAGTVAYDPSRHPGITDLLAEADARMYAHKRGRRAAAGDGIESGVDAGSERRRRPELAPV